MFANRACLTSQAGNLKWNMKIVKGPIGIIEKTKNPRTLQIWAKSQHKFSKVLQI